MSDIRESPALDILELLTRRGALVSYTDPFVATLKHAGGAMQALSAAEALTTPPDCIIICTNHSAFSWDAVVKSGIPVVDTRNALRGFTGPNIVRLSGRVAAADAAVV